MLTGGEREHLRFDHVVVGGVEDVASDDPHYALLHHGLVGSPGQSGLGVVLPAPEGGVGRDGDGAVWTWGGKKKNKPHRVKWCREICEFIILQCKH